MQIYSGDLVAITTLLKKYITDSANAEPGWGVATTLLSHGKFWRVSAPSENAHFSIPKACFANAQAEVISRRNHRQTQFYYVEGYACDLELPIPLHHAWLVNSEGEVFDPTWSDAEQCVYFGMKFKTSYVQERFNARGNQFDSLLLDAHNKHAILRDDEFCQQALDSAMMPRSYTTQTAVSPGVN
ncbi:hypothetical protein [Brucella pituitosa]|uniref:hypothetical protein n=1 Tax=Brucella pituitosa TaxID=571256 RepID=UPI003F4AE6E4